MSRPTPDRFVEFYKAAYGKQDDPKFGPFPWQKRVALRVCNGDWPRVIALPTAAGKTACIDIAVFALACHAQNATRRIFFSVDRRIVVDQAFLHAQDLAEQLENAKTGILKEIADSLREIAQVGQKDRPLDVYALRGGMYRETAWVRSPLQPTIIASTVDQVGSRLLFRGYGVSDSMKPIHAGLVGNDSLILLDEAHCSKPFDQTMQAIDKYRQWNDSPAPFRFVSLTATPSSYIPEAEIERDGEDDRSHPVLGKRIAASKPATLVVAERAKGKKGTSELVKVLAKWARKLADESAASNGCVGIIVNRVATARLLKEELGKDAVLLTGRMRSIDRDRLLDERLKPLLSNNLTGVPPKFVIGTQCLEVGADFDFHALVTECASLDALRQRFGRLNRVARRKSAKAVIVICGDQTEPKETESERDPIYGNSLPLTWKWMNDNKDGEIDDGADKKLLWIDFGIASIRGKWENTSEEDRTVLNAPSLNAPVLFPTHLDCWVQTHPIPTPDPDTAIFLHGPNNSTPDVQVVFRDDLGENKEKWSTIVALCPPSSSEAVPVRIGVFKKWLTGEAVVDASGDVEGEPDETDDLQKSSPRLALLWQGPNSKIVSSSKDVLPNAVYVVPTNVPDTKELGDFIDDGEISDLGEQAFLRSRDKAFLRLSNLQVSDDADDFDERLTEAILAKKRDNSPDWLILAIKHLKDVKNRNAEQHPDGGWVVTSKKRLGQFTPEFLDDEESSYSFSRRKVTLETHSRGVADHARRFAEACNLETDIFEMAGGYHDLGKLDPRFQRLLKGFSGGQALAKSGSYDQRHWSVHQYPPKARHELLSAALVATKASDDLLLHLIATHHGSARPFADPVNENNAAKSPFTASLFDEDFNLNSSAQNIAAWNAELPARFWRIIRKYGWWGAAYREAIFRLADHAESREEEDTDWLPHEKQKKKYTPLPTYVEPRQLHDLPLTGLDGSNPLAFLAALGTLWVCDSLLQVPDDTKPEWLVGPITISWGYGDARNTPVLHFSSVTPSETAFTNFLGERLAKTTDAHPMKSIIKMLEDKEHTINELMQKQQWTYSPDNRPCFDWSVALACESASENDSQLQIVRGDYLVRNLRSIMKQTTAKHLQRSLFAAWDYADPLNNQSLHWEPTEDRRHAYQWYMPSGDKTRTKRGGMLGANRLALEAWPLLPSFPDNGRVITRGFRRTNTRNTYWTWPLWQSALTVDGVTSILSFPELQEEEPRPQLLRGLGVTTVFRSERILVNKTPNLTAAVAIG